MAGEEIRQASGKLSIRRILLGGRKLMDDRKMEVPASPPFS